MTRVLIVDDAAFMRMMIKDILQKNGFEVVGEDVTEFKQLNYIKRKTRCSNNGYYNARDGWN